MAVVCTRRFIDAKERMVKEQLADFGIKSAMKMVHKNPDKNMPKLLNLLIKLGKRTFPSQMDILNDYLGNPESNVYQLVLRSLKQVDPAVLDRIIENFYLHVNVEGWQKQVELRNKYNCNIPWAILLDPTSACNLHCTGCWAADYGNRMNLSFDDMDSIICQGKELGIYMYIYTGGEPLVRKDDIIRLCEKHSDCIFLCFTNATLIDQEFCNELLRVKNFVPAISQEGSKETTDFRRSEGVDYSVYERVEQAMALLKDSGLPFGISCCYTSENYEAVSSSDYIDQLIDWGALFVWYFHYMPVGSDANVDLMCTPEQREGMYHKIREYREQSKAIFPMDFQNDGQFVQGCIAGGRRYLHINAAGDMDPCVFVHFSDSNIHEVSLLEGLQRPLFKAYHDGQPFNDNMLRPCPFLENPDALRELVHETGAHSSNLEAVETVDDLCDRCKKYAANWQPTAEKLWEADHSMGTFSH